MSGSVLRPISRPNAGGKAKVFPLFIEAIPDGSLAWLLL